MLGMYQFQYQSYPVNCYLCKCIKCSYGDILASPILLNGWSKPSKYGWFIIVFSNISQKLVSTLGPGLIHRKNESFLFDTQDMIGTYKAQLQGFRNAHDIAAHTQILASRGRCAMRTKHCKQHQKTGGHSENDGCFVGILILKYASPLYVLRVIVNPKSVLRSCSCQEYL